MRRLFVALALGGGLAAHAGPVVDHRIEAELQPEAGRLTARDTVTLPPGLVKGGTVRFTLHAGLAPRLEGDGRLRRTGRLDGPTPRERFRLELPDDSRTFTLRYGGTIRHELGASVEGVGRQRRFTAGLIAEKGIYLNGASGWYPQFGDERVRGAVTATLPDGWTAIGQGRRDEAADGVRWAEDHPQEALYLIAGRYTAYREEGDAATAEVYLRRDEPETAGRYLRATARYLALYSELIGPYPYAKFALVENFWETGYGMPSFTLLGPRVLRLPFIVHTSYPHEILHNWWGNGVFIDYAGGNWAEGLTAYLADHLLKARRGGGAEYRRDQLQKYSEYAADGDDFPLRAFRSRHGEASQAVGYGKALMLYHMLRLRLGDAAFLEGLRRLYRQHRFEYAGFDDVRRAFERAAGEDLEGVFAQWLDRTGAPHLALESVNVTAGEDGPRLRASLTQTQADAPYRFRVPAAVVVAGRQEPVEAAFTFDGGRRAELALDLPAKPRRLVVDPRFDVFRRLDPRELPPTLDRLFGADDLLLVVPGDAAEARREGYRQLARAWARGNPKVRVHSDRELDAADLEEAKAVWLLGRDNRFLDAFRERLGERAAVTGDGVRLEGTTLALETRSVVLTAPGRQPEQTWGWLAAATPRALPGLARKLPHYGKYSYLAFRGDGPENTRKGQWPVPGSPLNRALEEDAPALTLPPRPPLTQALGNVRADTLE
ncbi:MAG TPA: M1 family aminopeptidase [Gammaproteobacteria bacterium]|nr:M1 family aminopeptidase [Gammaproteobacteria bacterium]